VRTRTARLPGLRFVTQPPASPDVLPRMDIACFAGFAAGGPFHTPVAIEDAAQLTAVFGEDLALALDPETNELAYAQLVPATRAFLAGGGRRCWVVRVGEDEGLRALALPVPGLAIRAAEGALRPASLRARSPGTWADALEVAAVAQSEPAAVTRVDVADGAPVRLLLGLRFARLQAVRDGDLMRVRGAGWTLLAPARPAADDGVEIDLDRAVWTRPVAPADVTGAEVVTASLGDSTTAHAVGGVAFDAHGRLSIDVAGDPAEAPVPGSLLALDGLGAARAWLLIDELRAPDAGGSLDPEHAFGLVGEALWADAHGPIDPLPFDPATATAERLTLELWVRRPAAAPARLDGLGFAAEHPRWVGRLPSDAERHGAPDPGPPLPEPALWAQSAHFPLCGEDLADEDMLVPLALAIVPDRFLGAPMPTDPPLRRNGIPAADAQDADLTALAERTAKAFLHPELASLTTRAVGAAADYLRYETPQPQRLRGLHCVLDLDEVTLLAVPDAALRPCITEQAPPLPEVTAPTALPHPDPAAFADCGLRALLTPVLEAEQPRASGAATLTWTPTDVAGASYLVQASADPVAFGAPETLYDGRGTSLSVDARAAGPYVRVRAHSAQGTSDWSNGIALDAGPRVRSTLAPAADYGAEALLAIQRAALRTCGARGDMLGVLSLPGHYREDAAIAHATTLRPGGPIDGSPLDWLVPPLEGAENAALAHGAIYHPWPTVTVDGGPQLRRLVPDGPAAGVLAARARERGVWIAPASEPLRDVVALVPKLDRRRRLDLQEARVNELRQHPAGFLCHAEETLSIEEEQRPINVRRLLDLLRRLVILHGTDHVFASNDARLARRLQRGFERLLRRLYGAGAFAGETASQAFQVVTAAPRDGDAGQLIVELRVAPSLPMRFITVRLVQGAAGGSDVQEA
jgi:hypothetical protein